MQGTLVGTATPRLVIHSRPAGLTSSSARSGGYSPSFRRASRLQDPRVGISLPQSTESSAADFAFLERRGLPIVGERLNMNQHGSSEETPNLDQGVKFRQGAQPASGSANADPDEKSLAA